MRRLVYSYSITRSTTGGHAPQVVERMVDLWVRSLRGAGNFRGDVLLFTDRPDVRLSGVMTYPLTLPQVELKHLWLTRVTNYKALPYREYDTLMHVDLDTVCVNDINDLFATTAELRAAPSNLLLFAPQHVWRFLNRGQRIWYRWFSPRRLEKGVSACVFSCASSAWEANMGVWARAIEEHRNDPTPDLGDQSYLNLLLLRRTIPIRVYSREEIQHKDWSFSPRARIMHFPGLANRLELMNRYLSLYGETRMRGWVDPATVSGCEA